MTQVYYRLPKYGSDYDFSAAKKTPRSVLEKRINMMRIRCGEPNGKCISSHFLV
jgi:hypothetical protein